jgi:ribose transport system substrate-binding protein
MMRYSTKAVALGLCALSLLITSCTEDVHKNDRYGFIGTNVNLAYWQEADAGFKDAARSLGQFGVKADFEGPSGYAPEEQLDEFKRMVASHPSGILVAPARPEIFNDVINDAVANGIPIICVDTDAPGSKRIMFVGTDNRRAGMEAATRIAQLLHGQGTVVITAIPGQLNMDERIRGAEEVLSRYNRITRRSVLNDKGDPVQANDEISKLLADNEKIDGVLCLDASGGPGTAEALHRLNMEGKITVVAFDKNSETLDWIGSGVIAGTIAQKPYTMAYYGLKFLDDLHHNIVREFKDWRTSPVSPLPTRVDTGTEWVDKTNLQAFRSAEANRIKQLGGPIKEQ